MVEKYHGPGALRKVGLGNRQLTTDYGQLFL